MSPVNNWRMSRLTLQLFLAFVLLASFSFAESERVAKLPKYAAAGDASSQNNLGEACANGNGVPKDSAEAAKWWLKAAERGNMYAQYNLGVAYADGVGVPGDSTESVKWTRKAAEQGLAGAQHNLGVF